MSSNQGEDNLEEAPLTWDAEEDHLLSYFLGSETSRNGNSSMPIPELSSSAAHVETNRTNLDPPATPQIHYYPPASSSRTSRKQKDSKITDSHVPKMAPMPAQPSNPNLPLQPPPGVILHPQPPHTAPHVAHVTFAPHTFPPAASPISPAAMITTPENMVFPPPGVSGHDPPSQEEQKKAHLTWLQQINTVAMMANRNVVVPHPFPQQHRRVVPPVESDEKRERRLARNRESARQSRRRKKEKLETLGAKVDDLRRQLDVARREKLSEMDQELRSKRIRLLESASNGAGGASNLANILAETGPSSVTKQNAIKFQYRRLRSLLLPNYQRYLMWLLLQPEAFFTTAKAKKLKDDPNRAAGRLSSKQVGEEITSNWDDNDTSIPVREGEDGSTVRCIVGDIETNWALFAYDMQFSVDQEEKMKNFYKSPRNADQLNAEKVRVGKAIKTANAMRRGIWELSSASGERSNTILLNTLSAEQSSKFLDWMQKHRGRVESKMNSNNETEMKKENSSTDLNILSARLAEALKVPLES